MIDRFAKSDHVTIISIFNKSQRNCFSDFILPGIAIMPRRKKVDIDESSTSGNGESSSKEKRRKSRRDDDHSQNIISNHDESQTQCIPDMGADSYSVSTPSLQSDVSETHCCTQDLDLFLANTPPPSGSSCHTRTCRITSADTEYISSLPVKMMPGPPETAINIAVASRALFSLDDEHDVYTDKGLDEYLKYQMERESLPLEPGTAFPFIQALEHVNSCLRSLDTGNEDDFFNIVLMSHNHAHTGVRLIRSLQHHKLNVQRVCLTGGSNPVDYLQAYNIKLYLTSYAEEVEEALDKGFAAAAMLDQKIEDPIRKQLRIAFDLDAVLFSAESDHVYNTQGFEAFIDYEQEHANEPIKEGPLKEFAAAIGRMQKLFTEHRDAFEECPIRTYIVTARSACVGERALKTLRSWGLEVDELHFLSGASKGPILAAIKPHIFFDDANKNIEHAQEVGTPAAHVRHSSNPGAIQPKTAVRLAKKMSFFEEK